MDCNRAELELHAWLDGETAPQEAAELTSHLAECADCRASEAKARQIRQLLGNVLPPVASRSLDYRVMNSFLSCRSAERWSPIGLWLRRVFPAPQLAIWCLLAVLIGGLVGAFRLGWTLGQAEVRGLRGDPTLRSRGQLQEQPAQSDLKASSADLKAVMPATSQRTALTRAEQKVAKSAAVKRSPKHTTDTKDIRAEMESGLNTPKQAAVVLPAGFEPILEPTIRILGRHEK